MQFMQMHQMHANAWDEAAMTGEDGHRLRPAPPHRGNYGKTRKILSFPKSWPLRANSRAGFSARGQPGCLLLRPARLSENSGFYA